MFCHSTRFTWETQKVEYPFPKKCMADIASQNVTDGHNFRVWLLDYANWESGIPIPDTHLCCVYDNCNSACCYTGELAHANLNTLLFYSATRFIGSPCHSFTNQDRVRRSTRNIVLKYTSLCRLVGYNISNIFIGVL